MKKYTLSLFAVLCGIVLTDCSKKSSSPPALSYTVNNLSDINVTQYKDTTIYLDFAITYTSGTQEAVTITPGGMPGGIAVTPSSVSGTPSFGAEFTMNINMATAGTYPITVTGVSSTSGTKKYSFNVNVAANSDCAIGIAGTYTSNTTCGSYSGSGTGTYTGQQINTTSVTNQVILPTQFCNFTANVNCSQGAFTTQALSNVDFVIAASSGTFSTDTVAVTYTLTGDVNSTCTTVYWRQ